MKIHPTAIIDPKAEIADDVEIGPYSIVEAEVKIASGCKIASSVVLANGARLAEGIKVFTGAVIATLPQDLKFGGEFTTAEVGKNTTVREYCTINRATSATGRTIVGEDCLLMAYSHIAHDCHLGNKLIIANAVNLAGHVTIQDYAIIGGMVAIHQFVHIGMHCMIGGMFRVSLDVPPYCLAGGWPLKYEGLNIVGLKRRGFSNDTIKDLKEAYRLIYQSEMLRTEALRKIKSQPMIPEVENVVKFFEMSERGVI
jgi:UDP-N-acetylglucosamine acyltransferase